MWSDHPRIMVGSVSDRFRIVNETVFRACVVDSSIVICNCRVPALSNGVASGAGG